MSPILAIKPQKNGLFTTIDRLSTEWSLSLDFKILTAQTEEYTSFVHLTIDDNAGNHGDRTPLLHLHKASGKIILNVCSSINDDVNYMFFTGEPLTIGHRYSLEISQRYMSDGKYRFSVLQNGVEIHSKVNEKARQFYGVKFYLSSPWYEASDVKIYNLKHTNFW